MSELTKPRRVPKIIRVATDQFIDKYKDALAELGGYTIKDEKHDAIPRTPAERKADRETNAWMKRELTRRRVKKHRKGSV